MERRRMLLFPTTPAIPEGALYWDGDEMTAKTGGFSAAWSYGNGGIVTKNADNLQVYAAYGQNAKSVETINRIDVTKYSTLHIETQNDDANTGTYQPNYMFFYAITNRGTWDDIQKTCSCSTTSQRATTVKKSYANLAKGVKHHLFYDISDLIGLKYIGFASYGGNTWKAYKIWLE